MSPKEDKKKMRKKEIAPVKKGAPPTAKINKDKLVIEELTKQLTNVEDKPVSYTHLTLPTILLV